MDNTVMNEEIMDNDFATCEETTVFEETEETSGNVLPVGKILIGVGGLVAAGVTAAAIKNKDKIKNFVADKKAAREAKKALKKAEVEKQYEVIEDKKAPKK